jgi:hypothetical protein
MPERRYPKGVIAERGRELFDSVIKPKVQDLPARDFVAIDIESGDFETGPESLEVTHRLLERHPEAQIFMRRVGFPYTYRFGGAPRLAAGETPRWRRIPQGE